MNTRLCVVVVCGLGVSVFGCTVGSGSGEATGEMFIQGCGGKYNDRDKPGTFNLAPSFFAGEPVEDIRENDTQNRLTIRLQRHGGGFETNDVLQFDIVNSYEVARCVRGRQRLNPDTNMVEPDFRTDVCKQVPGAARVRIGPNDFVRATLTPFQSCRSGNSPVNLVATAVPCPPVNGKANCTDVPSDNWQSFIDFKIFGSVDARDDGVAPLDRKPIASSFKVDFGERLFASTFVLELADDHFLTDPTGPSTQTVSAIHGKMSGNFDFDFERGRAVQTFP
ncbi:MAG: hypothetical protein SF187_18815 [Deltaproteobacteria bacterium]|nr:hypothetical protein [Deltaproteobacteria bacterium]